MVHKEDRIIGAAEEVAGVTTDRKVSCSMHSQEVLVKVALDLILESGDVLGGRTECQIVQIVGGEPVAGCVVCEIALETSLVVHKGRVDFDFSGHRWGVGIKMYFNALEWTIMMHPPSLPDGKKILSAPQTLSLCATNEPSLPMLVSEPSKIGDFRRSS